MEEQQIDVNKIGIIGKQRDSQVRWYRDQVGKLLM